MNKITILTGENALKNVISMTEKKQGVHDDILGDMIVGANGVVKWSNYDVIETPINDNTKITTLSYDTSISDIKVDTIPTKSSTVISIPNESNNTYSFKVNTSYNISVDVLLSNWDSNDDYFKGVNANPNNPELTYFLNTDAFKDWGVPGDERYISKRSKAANKVNYTYTSDPRVVIADNSEFVVHIPKNVDVDYFVMHCSGHNGATSAVEYVYGESDKVYIDRHDMVADNIGTTDITVYLRNRDTEDYKLFNGNIENNKKFWTSIDFYKYGDPMKKYAVSLPPVEIVNKPIDDSTYPVLEELNKVATNIVALSGICLSEDKSNLFGVSDTNGLYKINFDGTSEQLWNSNNELDLEGLTIDGNGDLFACVENEQKVVKFSKADGYKTPEVVSVKDADKLVAVMKEFNNGFEGISWYKDDEFFIGNQFKPIVVVHYSLSKGILGTFELKWDDEIGGVTEIADLQYDKTNNCLWVIDSRTSNIFKYDLSGNAIAPFKTNLGAAPNTESCTIDFEANKLYVGADNNEGSLWSFKLS